jgi:hypothetical protein
MQPRVTDNDKDEITVSLDGKELRGWSYTSDGERRQKMLQAREYVEGWGDAAAQQQNPWAHVPKQYAGRWTFDYDEKRSTFFVCCGGHRILDAEDSEVCDAVCRAHNASPAEGGAD